MKVGEICAKGCTWQLQPTARRRSARCWRQSRGKAGRRQRYPEIIGDWMLMDIDSPKCGNHLVII